jgi:penicillin-binding protein-related factor A (putative recombinase)
MKESSTVQIIKKGLEQAYPGGFYHKPPDVIRGGQEIKKPYDIMYYYGGEFLAIEAKFVRNGLRFSFSKVANHQEEELMKVAMNKGSAYIAIHSYKPRCFSFISFVEIMDWKHWRETSKMKSLTHEELLSDSHVSFVSEVLTKKFIKNNKKNSFQYIDLENSYIIGD